MDKNKVIFGILAFILIFNSVGATCSDTDSGKNFYQSGTITLSNGTVLSDYCKDWSQSDMNQPSMFDEVEQRVVEYYCDDSVEQGWGVVEFTCAFTGSSAGLIRGCSNGACVSRDEMRKRGHWICYDKSLKEVGGETNCQSSSYYANLAFEDCKDKCNVNATCGVKWVESWGLCGCSDSDGGFYPFKKGGTGEITDRCMDGGIASRYIFGTQVSEVYCENGISKTTIVDCPDGCVDGACVRLCEDSEYPQVVYWLERSGSGGYVSSNIKKTTSWNYSIKGTSSGFTWDGQPMAGTDNCDQNNHEYITEYACNAYGQVENRYRKCSDMVPGTLCYDGACINPSEIPQDNMSENTGCIDNVCLNNSINDSQSVEEDISPVGQNETLQDVADPDSTLPPEQNESDLAAQDDTLSTQPDEPQIIDSQDIPPDESPIHDLCPPDKYLICHKEINMLCVAESSIRAHLNHGDYDGPCVNEKVDKKEISDIDTDEEIEVEFNNSIKISFRSLKEKKESSVAVTARVREVPPPDVPLPSRKVSNYFVIEHPNIENAEIADSKIMFTVSQDWLTSNNAKKEDIILGKFIGAWKDLATTYIRTEGDLNYFEADSLGFSTFAVTINNTVAPVRKTFAEQDVQTALDNSKPHENNKDDFTDKLLSWPFVFGASLFVLLLVALSSLPPSLLLKQKKPEKNDPELEKYNSVLSYMEKLKKDDMSKEDISKELENAGYDVPTIEELLKLSFNEKK